MKRISIIFISIILTFSLTGCGHITLRSDTKINKDTSGTVSIKAIYDDTIAAIMENDAIIDKKDLKVNRYVKDGQNIEEVKFNFKNIDELNKKGSKDKDIHIQLKKKNDILKNTYVYTMSFLHSFNQNTLKNNGKESTYTTSDTNKKVDNYINNISYKNTLIIPGKILSTNAIEHNGNTLNWTYKLSQINQSTVMTATYQTENKFNEVVLIIIGISAIISFIVYIIIKRRKTNI